MRRRVLIARLDSAGDVLLAGPAVRAVAHQADRVTFLCGRRGRAAAELLPGVDDIVEHTAAWIDPEPDPLDADATLALVADLAGRGIDQAVILTSFHQSPLPLALLLRMAGVPQVAATCEDYPGSLLDVRHRLEGDPHEVQRSLSLVGALGYRLPPDDDGTLAVRDDVLRRPNPAGDGPYVTVHPGASVPARAWAPESHAALVRALAEQGRKVVVTGGPGEESLTALVAGARAGAGAGRRAPAGPGEVADLGGATDLATLAVVLAGADAVVVANTGPAHLAAAVGTPVVSLFAPTVPAARWRPWSVPCRLLGHQDIGCAGCRARACPIPGHPCLGAVTVADVVAAVDELAPLRRPVGRRAS
ncbi:MAG TPA: glycosyltransferase family 9 protein [Acidimicrobiales bacterium]|nr:glycosyltransferase family 9 protein [Acidimicrobiales bacterium]